MKRRRVILTDTDRFAIRLALRVRYVQAMDSLDLHHEGGGVWIKVAGESWDAFKAFAGYPIYEADGT